MKAISSFINKMINDIINVHIYFNLKYLDLDMIT